MKKKFNELNAEGNDKDLATNGYEPGYWYSVGDGYRLLLSMRQQFLKYNYNDMIVKQGEEYAVHQENEQRIFLLDPYYGEFGAFANQLEDDVYFIATGKKKENGKDVNMSTEPKPWTQMPTTLIIPILTGTEYSPHWRSIKVDVDYENKTYEMLFDDPYSMGYFPEELKNEIIKSLKPNLNNNQLKLVG